MTLRGRWKSSPWNARLGSLVFLTAPLWLWALAWRFAYHPSVVLSYLGLLLLCVELVFVLMALVAAVVVVVGPVTLLFRRYRRRAAVAIGQALVFLASFVGGLFWGTEVWRVCINDVVERGEPLVAAVHAYVDENGHPPVSLDDLAPRHITTIPSTGVGVFPEFRYEVGKPDQYDGNPWVIHATPPCPPMGFDSLMYFPLQNYPSVGYGGSLERFGRWAYVHE